MRLMTHRPPTQDPPASGCTIGVAIDVRSDV